MRSYNPSKGSAAAGRAAPPRPANEAGASVRPPPLSGAVERLVRETEFRGRSLLEQVIERTLSPWNIPPASRQVLEFGVKQMLLRVFPWLNAQELASLMEEWMRKQGEGARPEGVATGTPPGNAYHAPWGYRLVHTRPNTTFPPHYDHPTPWRNGWLGGFGQFAGVQPYNSNGVTLKSIEQCTFPDMSAFARIGADTAQEWKKWERAPGSGSWRKSIAHIPQFGSFRDNPVGESIIPTIIPAANPYVGGSAWKSHIPWKALVMFNRLARQFPIMGRERGPVRVKAGDPWLKYPIPDLVVRPSGEGTIEPPSHVYEKPKSGQREVKLKSNTRTTAWRIFSALTETDDFVRSLHKALPKSCQRSRDWKDKSGKFHRKLASSMLRDLHACMGHLNVIEAMKNVVLNEIQDRLIGQSAQFLNKRTADMFGTTGIQGAATRLRGAQGKETEVWGFLKYANPSEWGLKSPEWATYAHQTGGGKPPELRSRNRRFRK